MGRMESGEDKATAGGSDRRSRVAHPRRMIFLIMGTLAVVAVLLWFAGSCLRPKPDLNQALTDYGFARIPESTQDVAIGHGTRPGFKVTTFIRFSATPEDITDFIRSSALSPFSQLGAPQDIKAPIHMPDLTYPSWWPGSMTRMNGRAYSGRLSVLVVDDESHTVYIMIAGRRTLFGNLKRRFLGRKN